MWGVTFQDISSRLPQPRGGSRMPSPSRVTRPRTTACSSCSLGRDEQGMSRGWPRRASSPDNAPVAKPSSRTAWPRGEARGSGPSLPSWTGWRPRLQGVQLEGECNKGPGGASRTVQQRIRLVPELTAGRSSRLVDVDVLKFPAQTVDFLCRAGVRRQLGEMTAVAAGGDFVS